MIFPLFILFTSLSSLCAGYALRIWVVRARADDEQRRLTASFRRAKQHAGSTGEHR